MVAWVLAARPATLAVVVTFGALVVARFTGTGLGVLATDRTKASRGTNATAETAANAATVAVLIVLRATTRLMGILNMRLLRWCPASGADGGYEVQARGRPLVHVRVVTGTCALRAVRVMRMSAA